MIKKILLGLGLAFLSFINFNNAGKVQLIGLSSYPSIYDNNYDITFLKGGGFITNYLGYGKNVLALESKVLFWWAENGQPYLYSPIGQGFFSNYYSCDELTDLDSVPTNCTSSSMTGDFTGIFKGFFSSVNAGDFVYYNYDNYYVSSSQCSINKKQFQMCFSSSNYHKSICFAVVPEFCYYGCQGGAGFCNNVFGGSFVNSQNLGSNTDFTSISNKWFGPAPGQYGYGDIFDNSEGSDDINLNNVLTGDFVYTNCTNGEVIQELENNGFNKYMCYGGLDNFDLYDSSLSYSPIPGTGKRLSQILSYSSAWDTPLEWFQFWDGLYQDRYNNSYNAMWESYPAVYRTWFDIYYQYGRNLNKNFDWVREYCTMTVDLNIDKTAIYKGQFFKGVCDTVIDKKINSSYYVGSGNSAVGINWNGIGNIGSGSEIVVSNDPSKFIQDYFNIIKSNFPSRYDLGGGVLPLYIITFMLAIILFRFISH